MLCTLNPIPLFTLYALRSMLNQRNPGTPPPLFLIPFSELDWYLIIVLPATLTIMNIKKTIIPNKKLLAVVKSLG